jgi:LL-H family phage holin
MKEQIIQISLQVMAVIIPVLAAMVVELIRRKLGTEKFQQIQGELAAKRELALLAVRFVEQVYIDLHGPEKYNAAAEWMAEQAMGKGIPLDAGEIKGLIEAALREMKDSFGEEWAKGIEE